MYEDRKRSSSLFSSSFWRLCGLAWGGALLIGVPARRAFADQPMTPEDAQQTAQSYQDQADQYRLIGGAAYKNGLVQRAEANARRYDDLAEELRTPPGEEPAPSPEAEHYTDMADHYKLMGGGAAYKTGLVQGAEAEARDIEAEQASAGLPPEPSETPAPCPATKPAVAGADCEK